MKYLAQNERDLEHYYIKAESLLDARHWVINHLDLSKVWKVREVDILFLDCKSNRVIQNICTLEDIPF